MAYATDGTPTEYSNTAAEPKQLGRATILPIAGIVAPPLLLAAIGLTHPTTLTAETAMWWHHLHLLLLPLFPLLGVNLWWLLAGLRGPLPWVGRIAGFVFICFYTALDVLAGIGTGIIRERATQENAPTLLEVERWLFAAGNALSEPGVWAFLLGSVVTSGLLIARHGRRALPGAIVLCAAAIPFLRSHIYFPVGVATMLVLALGFGLLQWARLTVPPDADRP